MYLISQFVRRFVVCLVLIAVVVVGFVELIIEVPFWIIGYWWFNKPFKILQLSMKIDKKIDKIKYLDV